MIYYNLNEINMDEENDKKITDELESDIENIDGAEDCEAKLEQIKEKLKSCEKEKGEYLDGWQRSKADYANFKREVAEGGRELQSRLVYKIITDLIPVLESMDQARVWVKDLGPIEAQMEKTLEAYGLTKFGGVGSTFDPAKYESIELVDVDTKEQDNLIQEVVNTGYMLGERVIRPAKVKVGSLRI